MKNMTEPLELNFATDPTFLRCQIHLTRGDDVDAIIGAPTKVLLVNWEANQSWQSAEHYLVVHIDHDDILLGKRREGESWEAALKRARDIEPYGHLDVDATIIGIASAMIADRMESATTFEAYAEIRAAIESMFQSLGTDTALADVKLGRSLTLSERAFIRGNPARAQVANVFRWLLPTLVVTSHESSRSDPYRSVIFSIDVGEELLPLLTKILDAQPSVIRALRELPSVRPPTHRHVCESIYRPSQLARYLKQLPPESFPDEHSWDDFIKLIQWANQIWSAHGDKKLSNDEKESVVLPHIIQLTWLALRRRSSSRLPYPSELEWLGDLRNSIRATHPMAGNIFLGNFGGKMLFMQVETWVVLSCLGHHPDDLAAEGRRWYRRLMPTLRESISSDFRTLSFPLTDIAITLPSGIQLTSIDQADELAKQSADAENCLASYLLDILQRNSIIISIHDGEALIGHIEFCRTSNGGFVAGCRKATRNRLLDKRIERELEPALAAISAQLNSRIVTITDSEQVNSEKARNLIRKTKSSVHALEAGRLVEKAIRHFKLQSKNDECHIALEITRLIDDGNFSLAKKMATRHAAESVGTFSRPQQLSCSTITQGKLAHLPPYDRLALQFLPLLVSSFHDGGTSSMVYTILSSSLDFSSKLRTLDKFHQLTQFQVCELRRVWTDESADWRRVMKTNPWGVATVAANTLANTLLLAHWFGFDFGDEEEAALINSTLKNADHGGLRKLLLKQPCDAWSPITAYIYRHLLPSDHPAWIIAEHCNLSDQTAADLKKQS